MKWLFKKGTIAERRRVTTQARTQPYIYHTYRSEEGGVSDRRAAQEASATKARARSNSSWLQHFGTIVIVLALVVVVGSELILSPDVQVVSLDPNHTSYIHHASIYQKAAQVLFSDSLANRNKLTVNTSTISKTLQHQFPELATISISIPFIGHTPIVYIAPVKAVLILTATNNQSYLIDDSGVVLSPSNVSKVVLVAVKDEDDSVLHVGQRALSSDTVSFIQTVLYQMQQKQLGIAKFVLPAGKSELDMYLIGQSYYVKFNLADNVPQQQVGTFLAVRHNLQGQGVTPSQYIDVRVEGRAYYK